MDSLDRSVIHELSNRLLTFIDEAVTEVDDDYQKFNRRQEKALGRLQPAHFRSTAPPTQTQSASNTASALAPVRIVRTYALPTTASMAHGHGSGDGSSGGGMGRLSRAMASGSSGGAGAGGVKSEAVLWKVIPQSLRAFLHTTYFQHFVAHVLRYLKNWCHVHMLATADPDATAAATPLPQHPPAVLEMLSQRTPRSIDPLIDSDPVITAAAAATAPANGNNPVSTRLSSLAAQFRRSTKSVLDTAISAVAAQSPRRSELLARAISISPNHRTVTTTTTTAAANDGTSATDGTSTIPTTGAAATASASSAPALELPHAFVLLSHSLKTLGQQYCRLLLVAAAAQRSGDGLIDRGGQALIHKKSKATIMNRDSAAGTAELEAEAATAALFPMSPTHALSSSATAKQNHNQSMNTISSAMNDNPRRVMFDFRNAAPVATTKNTLNPFLNNTVWSKANTPDSGGNGIDRTDMKLSSFDSQPHQHEHTPSTAEALAAEKAAIRIRATREQRLLRSPAPYLADVAFWEALYDIVERVVQRTALTEAWLPLSGPAAYYQPPPPHHIAAYQNAIDTDRQRRRRRARTNNNSGDSSDSDSASAAAAVAAAELAATSSGGQHYSEAPHRLTLLFEEYDRVFRSLNFTESRPRRVVTVVTTRAPLSSTTASAHAQAALAAAAEAAAANTGIASPNKDGTATSTTSAGTGATSAVPSVPVPALVRPPQQRKKVTIDRVFTRTAHPLGDLTHFPSRYRKRSGLVSRMITAAPAPASAFAAAADNTTHVNSLPGASSITRVLSLRSPVLALLLPPPSAAAQPQHTATEFVFGQSFNPNAVNSVWTTHHWHQLKKYHSAQESTRPAHTMTARRWHSRPQQPQSQPQQQKEMESHASSLSSPSNVGYPIASPPVSAAGYHHRRRPSITRPAITTSTVDVAADTAGGTATTSSVPYPVPVPSPPAVTAGVGAAPKPKRIDLTSVLELARVGALDTFDEIIHQQTTTPLAATVKRRAQSGAHSDRSFNPKLTLKAALSSARAGAVNGALLSPLTEQLLRTVPSPN